MPKLYGLETISRDVVTLFFGLVHGFGFAGYFELIRDVDQPLWSSLLFFALGIESAQIVLGALMLFLFVMLNVLGTQSPRLGSCGFECDNWYLAADNN